MHGDVTEFAGHAGHAFPNLVVQYDATANTGPESENTHIFNVAGSAEPMLTDGSGVGVVLENDGRVEASFDFFLHRIVTPIGQIRGFADHTGILVDDAGDADADAREITFATQTKADTFDRFRHLLYDEVASTGNLCPSLQFFEQVAICVDCGNSQVHSTEIHSDCE